MLLEDYLAFGFIDEIVCQEAETDQLQLKPDFLLWHVGFSACVHETNFGSCDVSVENMIHLEIMLRPNRLDRLKPPSTMMIAKSFLWMVLHTANFWIRRY